MPQADPKTLTKRELKQRIDAYKFLVPMFKDGPSKRFSEARLRALIEEVERREARRDEDDT